MKIEVTADTPVRIVGIKGDEDHRIVTVDDIALRVEHLNGDLVEWIDSLDRTPEGYVRFGDVWQSCPHAGWLEDLREAIGIDQGELNEQRRRLAIAEADEINEATQQAAQKEFQAQKLVANRRYLRPYAVEPTEGADA